MYRILINIPANHPSTQLGLKPGWQDQGDGPWHTIDEAIKFAVDEIAWPWIVADPCGTPVAYGEDDQILHRPAPTRDHSAIPLFDEKGVAAIGTRLTLRMHDAWYEHLDAYHEGQDTAITVGIGAIEDGNGKDIGSFAYCPHCGILHLRVDDEFCTLA